MKTYDSIMAPSDDGHWVLKSEADREIRRLKRALWIQRVKTAEIEIRYWQECLFNEPSTTRAGIHSQRLIPPKTFRTIREWLTIWDNVEHKCRAMAERYGEGK